MKELNRGLGRNQKHTIWLRIRGSNFCHRFCRRNPNGSRKTNLFSNLAANLASNMHRLPETQARPADVNKGLVNAHLLNERAEATNN